MNVALLIGLVAMVTIVAIFFRFQARGQIKLFYLCKKKDCKGICLPDTLANKAPVYFGDNARRQDDLVDFLSTHSKVIVLKVLFGPWVPHWEGRSITDPMAAANFLANTKYGWPYLIKRRRSDINEPREYHAVCLFDTLSFWHDWRHRRNLRRLWKLTLLGDSRR